MDNKKVHERLQKKNLEGKLMWWQHGGMKFYDISEEYTLKNIKMKSILRCFYNDQVYYFNIRNAEVEITEEMIAKGKWQVYTWSN